MCFIVSQHHFFRLYFFVFVYLHPVDQVWSSALKNPNPKCLMKGWCCCCVSVGSGYNRVWSTPLLNLKLMWFKTFLKSSVFLTKWKTTCCFVESTSCFALRSFEKGWKLFWFGWLNCQAKTIGCFVVSTDCFFENPNKIQFWMVNLF